jgi:hypothetical protein
MGQISLDPTDPTVTSHPSTSSTNSKSTNNIDNNTESKYFGFSTMDFELKGPWSVATVYSKAYGTMMQGKWVQGLDIYNAITLLFELGNGQRRINGTYGYMIDDFQRIKVSAEYLQQNINFDFDSGDLKKWVGQGAYGVTYNYLISQGFFHDVDVNAYYSKAGSKELESKIFHGSDGNVYENFRRIAGGIDESISVGAHFQPMQSSMLGVALNYDKVSFDMIYDNTLSDLSGFGATLSLEQLLSKNLKLKLTASNRKPTNSYEAELNLLVPMSPGNRLEIGLTGAHLDSGNGLNSDDRFGINIGYSISDALGGVTDGYTLGVPSADADIANWTATPAVYMSRVLAIKDQKSELVTAPTMGTIERIYKIGQEVFDDISSSIQIGCSRLQEVYDDGTLAHYGLGIFLQGDGKQVVIKGKTPLEPTPDFVDIPLTLVNIGGIYSQGAKLKLKIESNPVLISIDPSSIPASSVLLNLQAVPYTVTVKGTGFRCQSGYPQLTLGSLAPLSPVSCYDNVTPNVAKFSLFSPGVEPSQVDVTLKNQDGGSAIGKGFFAFAAKPTFDSLSATTGNIKGGDKITVKGSGFKIGSLNLVKGVYFGGDDISGTAATITSVEADSITILTPTTTITGMVDVWVVTAGGALKVGPKQFTYYDTPLYLQISPIDGRASGGEKVTITGSGFAKGATYIKFDQGNWLPGTVDDLGATVTVYTPAHAPQLNIPVYVKGPGGTSKVPGGFNFVGVPKPTGVNLNSVSVYGGYQLVIAGQNFYHKKADYSDVEVKLSVGGQIYTITPTSVSDTLISVLIPAATTEAYPEGDVTLTVTTTYGLDTDPKQQSGELLHAFTFKKPGDPQINTGGIIPSSGSEYGGTDITIKGSNFLCINRISGKDCGYVQFGDEQHKIAPTDRTGAKACTNNQNTLCVTIPLQQGVPFYKITTSPTAVDLTVINPQPDGRTVKATGGYSFILPTGPTITSVDPNSGVGTVVNTVKIYAKDLGTSDISKLAVKFGDQVADLSDATISSLGIEGVKVPIYSGSALPVTVDVTVTNLDIPDVPGKLTGGYTFKSPPPQVTSIERVGAADVDKIYGGNLGNYDVTINGLNFDADHGCTVSFRVEGKTFTLSNVRVLSSKKVTATFSQIDQGGVYPANGSIADVIVTNSDGQSATLPLAFYFLNSPYIAAVTNIYGTKNAPLQYGGASDAAEIVIYGSGFKCTPIVKVGDTAVAAIDSCSSTEIHAVTMSTYPASPTPLLVQAINEHGIESVSGSSTAAQFTFETKPSLDHLDPTHGKKDNVISVYPTTVTPLDKIILVKFGGNSVYDVTTLTDHYTVKAPIQGVDTVVDVVFVSSHGVKSSAKQFTYDP